MKLTELLNTSLPLIQAPMAGVQDSALALEVCRAGGLGSLPCAMLGPEQLERELKRLHEEAPGAWNANFFCHTPPAPDAQRDAAWQRALAPYYAEFGLDSAAMAAGSPRRPFDAEALALLQRFPPAVVSFHFGLPEPALLEGVRALGARILSSATTLDEALWLEANGVDAVIVQGLEAGGHRGMFLTDDLTTQVGTLALLPQVARSVRVPLIAAGGIADAAGIRAAMALGASGVQIGTAYLLCPEAKTSSVHRQALQQASARHTALTNVFSGRPARGIVNRLIRELGPICPDAPAFPLAAGAIGPLRSAAEKLGIGDCSPLWAGQNASGCKAVPAYELTRELASGFAG
jgi:nitronate monooxygenase